MPEKALFIEPVKYKLTNIFDSHFQADLFNDVRKNGEGNKLKTYRWFKHKI